MRDDDRDYFFTNDDEEVAFKPPPKIRKKGGHHIESKEGCPYYGDEEKMIRMCGKCIEKNCY